MGILVADEGAFQQGLVLWLGQEKSVGSSEAAASSRVIHVSCSIFGFAAFNNGHHDEK